MMITFVPSLGTPAPVRWAALLVLAAGLTGCLAESRDLVDTGFADAAADAAPRDGGRDAGLDAGADAEVEDTGPPPDAGLPTYTWYQHVQPIIAARCLDCHGAQPMFGAPMSLVSYGDTQVILPLRDKPVHSLMVERVKSTNPNVRMPYGRPALSPVEIEIIEYWSAVGALEGDVPDSGLHEDAAEPDTGAEDAAAPDTGDFDGGVDLDAAAMD